MNFLRMKHIALSLILTLFFVSCMDDGETSPTVYSAWGFIYSLDSEYYVTIDGGTVFKVSSLSDDAIAMIEENDRIILNYYITETPEETTYYDYMVEISSFLVIDYKNLIEVNDESRDTLGDGYMQLGTNSYLSGDILNLEIYFTPQEGDHVFTLCYDETLQEEGEDLILDLRNYYPEEGDDVSTAYTYKSFNIADIVSLGELNEENKIPFILRINYDDSQEQEFNFEYDPE